MKYLVEQFYYHSGRVEAKLKTTNDEVEPHSKTYEKYDYYLDVFDKKKDALQYIENCKNA